MTERELIEKYGNPVQPHGVDGWRVPDYKWMYRHITPLVYGKEQWVHVHDSLWLPLSQCLGRACRRYDWSPKHMWGYSCRHKMLDPKRDLSMHAWGLAIDIDPDDNPYGSAKTTIPEAVIEIFEDNGFEWAGRWRTPDPMHFQIKGDQ